MIQSFSKNEKGQDYIVSDLHGQYDLFINALQGVGFNSNYDRIFCVGDLIDRGPHSLQCFELVLEPWFFSLRGNHEELMLNALQNPDDMPRWMRNGGGWFHEISDDASIGHLVKLAKSLPVAFELESRDGNTIGVCHAQCPVDDWKLFHEKIKNEDSSTIRDAIWGRSKIKNWPAIGSVAGISFVVAGHTIVPRVARFNNQVWIDTGASMGLSPSIVSIDALAQLSDISTN